MGYLGSSSEESRLILGSLAAFMCALAYGASSASVQIINGELGDWEINCFRFGVGTVLGVLYLTGSRQLPAVERRLVGWLLLVSCSIVTSNFASFAAAPYLPLSIHSGLTSTVMNLSGALFDIFIHRSLKLSTFTALVLCTVGLALTTQPHFLGFPPDDTTPNITYISMCHGHNEPTSNITSDNTIMAREVQNGTSSNGRLSGQAWGYLLVVLSGVGIFLNSLIAGYRLSGLEVSKIYFWTSAISAVTSLVPMFVLEKPVLPPKPWCWATLLLHSFSVAIGCFFSIYASQRVSPFIVSTLMTLEIVVVSICQYTLLKNIQPGHNNGFAYSGIVLIIVGNVFRPLMDWWRSEGGSAADKRVSELKSKGYEMLPTTD